MNTVKEFKDFKLILDEQGSGNERMLLKMENPAAEYVIEGFAIKKEDITIDIGAHIGRLSIYAAVHGKQVYSFEPDSRNVEKLKANIEINNLQNIKLFAKAVNATGESVSFPMSPNPSENSLFKAHKNSPHVTVKATTLRDIFDSNGINFCNFLKLDCEGAEYEILQSLSAEYYKKIDKVVLEYHDHLVEGKSLKDLIYVLSKNNFRVAKITRGAWYTGLLYVKKTKLNPFIYNYFKVYIFDMFFFILSLIKKKLK